MARQTRKSSRRPPPGAPGPGPLGMLARGAALILLAWVAGFIFFVLSQAGPAELAVQTQGVAVLTGGPGRLARGVAVLEAGSAERLLISGVDRSVRPQELLGAAAIPPRLFECCIDLGFDADSTRANAQEVALWVERRGYRSVRLVTAGYHMPRARAELAARLPEGVAIVEDGVRAGLPFWAMLQEYGKFQAAWLMLRVRPA